MSRFIENVDTKGNYKDDMSELKDGAVMGMAMMMNMEAKKRGLADEQGNPTPKGMEALFKEMRNTMVK